MLLTQLGAWDTTEVFLLWSDFETVKHTNWPHTPTLTDCTERMEKILQFYRDEPDHFGPYTIRMPNGRFVGMIGADLFDHARQEYEVWYTVRRDAWGQGIARRALGELLDRLAASGRVAHVRATAVTSHAASQKVLERQGFERTRILPARFRKHGLTLDLYVYERDIQPVSCRSTTSMQAPIRWDRSA